MTTNISKVKCDEMIGKISPSMPIISTAPQDENTNNLLTYLFNLEKDANGKKYDLFFKEHPEIIDTVLMGHTRC